MLDDVKMTVQAHRANKLIYLVDDDAVQIKTLSTQIGYFGYTVVSFTEIQAMKKALSSELPAAIIMDIVFPEGEMAGVNAINGLKRDMPNLPPVFFISGNSDLKARIQAVRAGGSAYFTKPVNVSSVIDALDRMTLGDKAEPFRVLIVDDSVVQARVNSLILQKAGMQVTVVTDSTKLIEPLIESSPELILLDIYMPDFSGVELARVIRQMDAFISIPIVYLSSESDRDKQLDAVGLGADDFLTKPIVPRHLISSTSSRIERYRQLRNLMYRDSLTGLLNHATTKDRLEKEAQRASRQGGDNNTLSFAMLDLDHFKSVNDQHGHPTGDRVLKGLAQMLTRRLRTTEIIGRCGGEEFGVIFPATTKIKAMRMIDEIRENFSRVRYQSGSVGFSVTFSCGIAEYPQYGTMEELWSAADEALYKAKKNGRNRVEVAMESA